MSKIGRNDPCFCGSGKKLKKCCIDSYNEDRLAKINLSREENENLNPDNFFSTQFKKTYEQDVNLSSQFIKENKFDEAIKAAENLLTKYPDSPDGLEKLSEAYEAINNFEMAALYYEKLTTFISKHFDVNENNKDYKQYLNKLQNLKEKAAV